MIYFAGAVIASVTAIFTAYDGKVTHRPLVGEKGAEASRVYTIPKAEAAKWKRIALLVDGAEGRKGEPGYALTERGLVTHFVKDEERWCPENHWMAQHYVAITTPRKAFLGVVDGLCYEYQAWCVATNGIYATYPEWEIDKIGEAPYEDIVYTVYERSPGMDYNAFAKLYRRHFERKCRDLQPIARRQRTQPSLAKLRNAFAVRQICARKWPRDPAAPKDPRAYNRDFTPGDEPKVKCVKSFAATLEGLRRMKAAGLDDVALCLAGWQTGGYDGRCPATFPVCEEAGGEAELRKLVAGAKELGYLVDAHNNYTDAFTCSPLWNDGDVAGMKADGSFFVNHDFWDGGRPYDVCLKSIAEKIVYSDLRRTHDLGFDGAAYIDVFSAAWPYHCRNPKHPATRKDTERIQIEIAKFCRGLNGGFASECCFDHMIPYVDYINYSQGYVRKMRQWAAKGRHVGWDDVVPFFELAFHDVVLSNPDKVTQEIPRGADRLLLWEFGGRPIVYYWEDSDIPAMKELYDEFQKFRALQGVEMVEHKRLENGVVRVLYATGDRVYVNYDPASSKTADGYEIPPLGYVVGHEADGLPDCVDGIYPRLAMFNREGECGTGAVVPWAGSLWAVTYGPHAPVGSSDKLYQITPDLKQIIRDESVGGTPANRLIHRETNQLLIGPYVIDAQGGVRVVAPEKMPGRLTGAARHLTDPNKVYVATMETGLYELDMRTLAVNTLVRENGKNDHPIMNRLKLTGEPLPPGWETAPQTRVPGYHAKGLASGFGKVFISNNGEDSDEARQNPFVPSGVLAWWNERGKDWTTIRRCQFTEVTTADGICGNAHPDRDPVWALGWDAKSVILGVTTNGTAWSYYRLPKASHCYDGAHGWNTEWPRIRDVGFGDGTLLATMHGTFWKFPKGFSPATPDGIRPLSTYLKVIGDFCRWNDRLVFGCDDQALSEFLGTRALKKGAPKRARSQSNLWFVRPEDLTTFGPPTGEGWVWLGEDVKKGDVSDPFLVEGYETCEFSFTDAAGRKVRHELRREGDWARVVALEDAKGANAHFVFAPQRPAAMPRLDAKQPYVEITDDNGRTYRFPNVNGDTFVLCREVATERDLLYVGGVFYELPAENAGGFEVLRPIALADEPVRSIEARLGLVFMNGQPMALDRLWKNCTAAQAYWLWRDHWKRVELPVDAK